MIAPIGAAQDARALLLQAVPSSLHAQAPRLERYAPARVAPAPTISGSSPHLTRKPVHGADTEANLLGHLDDTDALGELLTGALYLLRLLGFASGRPSLVRTMPALLSNLPSLASLALMVLRPARIRWRIIERSNSAKAPVT